MAVKIRLMRVGKKKQPAYRVVVADARSPRDGRIIETIGHYGPRQDPSRVDIDGDRALAWLRQGAQPTEQVQKLLSVTGVWATFEAEKGGKVVTKLNRRGHVTGKVQPKVKAPPEAKAAITEMPATPVEAGEETSAEASTEAPAGESAPEESAPGEATSEESAPEERATEESTE